MRPNWRPGNDPTNDPRANRPEPVVEPRVPAAQGRGVDPRRCLQAQVALELPGPAERVDRALPNVSG